MMISTAMLMTAGLGTRLRPFTNFTTKALLPLLGAPMSQYSLDALLGSEVDSIVANIHHDAENTRKGLLALEFPRAKIVLSDESRELLGSAGGIRRALPLLGENAFFLANADVLCDVNWRALETCHRRLRSQWGVKLTLTIFPQGPRGASYREILFDRESGLLTGLGNLEAGRPFFVGAAILEPEALAHVPDLGPSDFVPMILEPAIREKKAGVFLTDGVWYDIGSPSLWHSVHLDLINRLEVGHFTSPVTRLWKTRIETLNKRIADRGWVSRDTSVRKSNRKSWASPFYWNGKGEDSKMNLLHLGPSAILYGQCPPETRFQNGIGYGGQWVSI